MPRNIPAFAAATLAPLPLLVAGALWGGPWIWLALGYMTLLTATLDLIIRAASPGNDGDDPPEFPAADALSVVLALGQFAIMALAIHALAGDRIGPGEKIGLFAATGLFAGQIGNSNAHELIHRGSRLLHNLGKWVYISILFGHHTSAHVLVHHVRVATRADPSTARRGEGLYRFVGRAWRGSFREGLRAETDRLRRSGRSAWRHPYVTYTGGALLVIGIAALLGGWRGILWHLALAGYATVQLLMSDYVQHYGLLRAARADGRPEPVGDRHSWNAPHPVTAAMMLNAPRHSDHHAHPGRRYPALRLPPEAPMLPASLPVMATLALIPPLWRRIMDPRAARWHPEPGDRS